MAGQGTGEDQQVIWRRSEVAALFTVQRKGPAADRETWQYRATDAHR